MTELIYVGILHIHELHYSSELVFLVDARCCSISVDVKSAFVMLLVMKTWRWFLCVSCASN